MSTATAIPQSTTTEATLSDGKGHVIPLTEMQYERARRAVLSSADEASERITTGEAAKILGVSRKTVMRLLDAGKIPYTRFGSQTYRYMQLDDVLEYKIRCEVTRKEALDEMRSIMYSHDTPDSVIAEYLKQFV